MPMNFSKKIHIAAAVGIVSTMYYIKLSHIIESTKTSYNYFKLILLKNVIKFNLIGLKKSDKI